MPVKRARLAALVSVILAPLLATAGLAATLPEAIARVNIVPGVMSAGEVMATFHIVARRLGMRDARPGGPSVLHNETHLRAYFIGADNQTALRVTVVKANAAAVAEFAEIGAETFSVASRREYNRLLSLLMQNFGVESVVVPANPVLM